MRVCVLGGGLAGATLAWRLAGPAYRVRVDLVLGADRCGDATQLSAGAVRAYEPHVEQRRLATASLLELTRSAVLRAWSGYVPVESAYLRVADPALATELAEVNDWLPASAELRDRGELSELGWGGLPANAVAIWERRAGRVSPSRFRDSVLVAVARRRSATVLPGQVTAIEAAPSGAVRCRLEHGVREYDAVVVAAGAWTPRLLAASALPAYGYRVKSIQCAVFEYTGWRPPAFVDETAGCYGMPVADGLLLGVPTEDWNAEPGRPLPAPQLHERAAALATTRFPRMRLGPIRRRIYATDCYTDPPVLRLRRVAATDHDIYTFSGGSGGSAKTVLAASLRAAEELTGRRRLALAGSRHDAG